MATQILKVGSQFSGGVIKEIRKNGVLVLKGTYTRLCLLSEIEKELKRKGVTK